MGVLFGLALVLSSRAVVVVPVANMHSKATTDADVVSQARYGMTINTAEEVEGWVHIQTPDGYWGWTEARSLRKLGAEEPAYAAADRAATVESLTAHIYREASGTRHAPLTTVPFETRLEVTSEESNTDGGWLALRLPDDRQGWVRRGDVTLVAPLLTAGEVVRLARRFVGLPYTWGGTTSFGFDCSGFTQMLCRRGGVAIPRDASPQFHWNGMTPVDRTDLRPGDLVFFGRNPEKPSHVGMYAGDGDFIHSTAHEHPVLQVSRLADEHWAGIYIGARRWKP